MKNPDRREPSRVNMFFLTHKSRDGKPMSEGTSKIFVRYVFLLIYIFCDIDFFCHRLM